MVQRGSMARNMTICHTAGGQLHYKVLFDHQQAQKDDGPSQVTVLQDACVSQEVAVNPKSEAAHRDTYRCCAMLHLTLLSAVLLAAW